MEAQPKRCRRCLLQDMADENDYYASVVRYRATMPRRVRALVTTLSIIFPRTGSPPGAGFFVCKGSILLFCCNIMPLSPLYPPFSFVIITIC